MRNMRIIFANKYYFLKRGAERHVFDLTSLLERAGHQVVPFAMRHPKNIPSPWEHHFVSRVETERVNFSWQGLRTAGRILYSFEAREKFARLLDETKPDLVHVHNIYHQISPSILGAAARRGVPVVMTSHDYALIAPDHALFHDGAICERTKPRNFWRAVPHRCVKGSYVASKLSALEMSLHRALGSWDAVGRIIVPSAFMARKFEEYGVPAGKIQVVPHFVDASAWTPREGGVHALFVGSLSSEKGVEVLVRAAALAPEVPVHIVGTGPEEERLRALVGELGASNVEFRGFRAGEELAAEYSGARFVVVPSIWYEPFGLACLEGYASGKPVIASAIGGLPEVVRDGETGALVPPGDAEALAEVMRKWWSDPARCASAGRAGRQLAETEYAPQKYLERILAIYAKLLQK